MSKILQQNARNAQKLYRRVASRTRISRIIASVSRVRIVISRWRVNDSRQETIIRIVPSALGNYLPRSASRVTSQLPVKSIVIFFIAMFNINKIPNCKIASFPLKPPLLTRIFQVDT